MRRLRKITIVLPVLLVVAGLAIPAIVGGGGSRPPAPVVAEARYAGRTVSEWREMAAAALEGEKYALAIKYLKTVEKAEPGRQYAAELAMVRAARRRSLDVAANRERMMGAEPRDVVLDGEGGAVSTRRTVVALPGESLWSIAAGLAAAREGILPSELPSGDARVYAVWDELTDLNGLRGLEVGEPVVLPPSAPDL